jgi:aryl sulfotransferase
MQLGAAEFFHDWVLDGGAKGDDNASFFVVENSFWAARHDPNMLLVHYNDLKRDCASEMRRIAKFLGIAIAQELWPGLIEGASLAEMRAWGDRLMPQAKDTWGSARRFLNEGASKPWADIVRKEDLALYDAAVKRAFSPALARWVEHGRHLAGDPEKTD